MLHPILDYTIRVFKKKCSHSAKLFIDFEVKFKTMYQNVLFITYESIRTTEKC